MENKNTQKPQISEYFLLVLIVVYILIALTRLLNIGQMSDRISLLISIGSLLMTLGILYLSASFKGSGIAKLLILLGIFLFAGCWFIDGLIIPNWTVNSNLKDACSMLSYALFISSILICKPSIGIHKNSPPKCTGVK